MPPIARLAFFCLLLLGCTRIQMIRTEPPSPASSPLRDPSVDSTALLACNTGSATKDENVRMWETYSEYSIGYVEFDDQGWAYQHDTQLKMVQQQIAKDMNQYP